MDSGNNLNWRWGGGGVLEPSSRTGVFWRIWSKISGSLAGLCITDSLSHTTYVETNKTNICCLDLNDMSVGVSNQCVLLDRRKQTEEIQCKNTNSLSL